jgi:hypothetical protein
MLLPDTALTPGHFPPGLIIDSHETQPIAA